MKLKRFKKNEDYFKFISKVKVKQVVIKDNIIYLYYEI